MQRYTLKSTGDERDRILWTGPQGPGRNKLMVHISYDEGQTFTPVRLISDQPAAYSDMTILADKTVGVLWEGDDYRFITLSLFSLEGLEPETDESN